VPKKLELKENTMPHVIVKLYPGRSEQQKNRLAEQIVKDVVAIAKCEEEAVSVANGRDQARGLARESL
jgi:hypothetical protein